MFTCSLKLSRKAQGHGQTGSDSARYVARCLYLVPWLMALLTSASGNTLTMAIQRTGVEDFAYLVYLFAGFVILLIILYFARKYIRVPAERSDYLHIPELAPEVKVWDDTNIESLISLQGGTIPLTPNPSNKQSQGNWPGLIPAALHYLGFRETGRNLSVYRRYLLETLQNEAKARISLRELAVRHKYFEQEAVNEQLRLENKRMELLWERRRIEMENRWRLKFFSSAGGDTQSQNSSEAGGEILNYFHRKQPPRVRCIFRDSFDQHSESVESISFSPDGRFLASGGLDEHVRVWDLHRAIAVKAWHANSKVYSVAFSPKAKPPHSKDEFLAAGTESGIIELWKTEPAGWQPQTALSEHSEAVESLAFSPDGKWLASGGWDRKICLFDLSLASQELKLINLTDSTDAIAQVAFLPDEKETILAWVGWDKTLEVRILKEEELEKKIKPGQVPIDNRLHKASTLAFSPDGKLFAAADLNGGIRIWQTATMPWQDANMLLAHEDEVGSLSFSRNGNLLAIGLLDGTMKLWSIKNIGDPQIITTIRRHTAAITCVAFSPDGKTLASASRDKTIKLWDVKVLLPNP